MIKDLISKITTKRTDTAIKTIDLPIPFSDKEIEFIEEWYSEEGMKQLLSSRGKKCRVLNKKPPIDGVKYVDVDDLPVLATLRNKENLQAFQVWELKTVTLLLLNEWIK
jgi:hypothetical protein